uniref:G-protein coupled receptors family 1 profile domain-containing protein n=1 Tax=Sinocyclocheilus anshuiensis TaxID=1608454 RepID=A0A671LRZ2_9TELE
ALQGQLIMKTTTSISNVSLQPDVHNHSALHSCRMDESYKYIISPLCYSLTFLLSLVLNSTVLLWSYQCRSGHQWNTSFSLPFLVASYVMRDHWVFGDFMCRLVRFLFYFNLYCSIFFLTCISVHRYMGICHPIRTMALESKRAVRGICATVWVIVFILTCPIVRFAKMGCFEENRRNCWDDAIDSEFSEYVPYGIVLHLLGFFFPFIVIAWCYSQVVWTIFQTLHSQPQVQEEGGMRRKSIKTIITITILFTLCFLPFHITRTLFLVLKETKAIECQTMRMVSICYKIAGFLQFLAQCPPLFHNRRQKLSLLWTDQRRS